MVVNVIPIIIEWNQTVFVDYCNEKWAISKVLGLSECDIIVSILSRIFAPKRLKFPTVKINQVVKLF